MEMQLKGKYWFCRLLLVPFRVHLPPPTLPPPLPHFHSPCPQIQAYQTFDSRLVCFMNQLINKDEILYSEKMF